MKILIFEQTKNLKNNGGPSGYLYNIHQYLKEHPHAEIEFIDKSRFHFTLFSTVCGFLMDAINSLSKHIAWIYYPVILYRFYIHRRFFSKSTIAYLNSFDFIHVHSSPEILCHFRGSEITAKIILTAHCPEPTIDEFAGGKSLERFLKRFPQIRDWCIRQEAHAYDLCDKVMFPVIQAREPYENASKIYKEKFTENNDKFFYIPTALCSTEVITSTNHYADNHNIPSNALKLCYIGRHSKIKGYYFLKESATQLWQQIPDAYFMIGGMRDCKIGVKDNRWIELGWVETPKLLNEVDAFILPNKNTYFDLILLEILRQGTPVILTRTGGNKWFEDYHLEGMKFFDYGNTDELITRIQELRREKEEGKLDDMKKANRAFFQKEFGMDLYIQRYLQKLKTFIPS